MTPEQINMIVTVIKALDTTGASQAAPSESDLSGAMIGRLVIIRTYSAGVHFGELVRRQGREVLLRNARRLWNWQGAFTLSAVAERGIVSGRVSMSVPEILLTEAIEVIPLSSLAADQLTRYESHDPS